MLEYTSKQDAEFTIINEKYTFIKIELPASVKSHVIQNIESGNLNVSDLVATLDENAELQRYSKFNLLTSLLNLSDELTSNKDLFLKDLSIYINDHISSFSREEIETILYQYSSLDQPHLLNLAIANLNSMLAPNDVSLYVSYGLRLELFRFYIAEKDFQSAYHLLNSNAEHNLIPPASYIASYLSLLDTVANSLESSQKNKTMIFNAYSAPLSRVLRAHGGDYITPEMVSIVLRWMNSKEIVWFINYLKLCQAENFFTGFNSLMIDLYCVRLVEEYDLGAESNASPSEFGFESAGKLTSFINHLATSEFEPIDDSTIKTIINSYCKFGSSVAVRLWLGKLSEKLSAEDISTFTESLKSCQSQSPGNFPGFGKQALQSTIAYIEGLK
ncbi:hypothetical protein CANARDRAFT_202645 [[Candida] arabinofermentans NRRL YB-2248]|uniref:Uncharacterized protein n=1 Tax=[Candida] arabinofermentans NRRL YB-2248 TaxID=983967 RepID=A0A1E4SW48_9ASCO|nr:hypothetical protein CANARDRAFT_202645 [[Candida] arabinofermentans NRRL YB-2248]